jgi:hypothetical protein
MKGAKDILASLPENEKEVEAVRQDFAAEIPRRVAGVLRFIYQTREKFSERFSEKYRQIAESLIKELAGEGELKELAYHTLSEAEKATKQNDDVILLHEEQQAFTQTFGNLPLF